MLYDSMQNLSHYRGLFKGLDVLIDWLKDHRLEELPLSKTQILGYKVFVNGSSGEGIYQTVAEKKEILEAVMSEVKGNLYAVMKKILEINEGLHLGSVRKPCPVC